MNEAAEIAFHCFKTCCNFVTAGLTEYSFLSLQSVRYEPKTARPHSVYLNCLGQQKWSSRGIQRLH